MNKKVKVYNRDNGYVGYTIPELNNLQRQFAPQETKEIEISELKQLYWTTGGRTILEEYLSIQDPAALDELQMKVEPEYFYTEDKIKEILLSGSLDEFLDMLDFAPVGIIESIKSLAVSLKLNDVAKREAILEKTGFNVSRAIEVQEAPLDGGEAEAITHKPVRRTAEKKDRRIERK